MSDGFEEGRILFRSDDLLVRQVGEIAAGGAVAVTFDCYGDWHGNAVKEGFGERHFAINARAAIHVMPRGNDWYQYPTTEAALAAVKQAVAGAARVVAYGSSMGAYAAIRFADRIAATAVLALSPQYSVDPAKAPFEKRWLQEGRTIAFRPELDGPIRSSVRPVIAYDDRSIDRRHVDRIAADIAVERLPLPFGSHPVGLALMEAGLLQPILHDILDGSFDGDAVRAGVVERLRGTSTYWAERARAQPRWLKWRAVGFARRALALAPQSPLTHHVLATSLDRVRRYTESLPLHEEVARLSDRQPGYLRPYSFARARYGDLEGALALAREVSAADPGRARNHEWEAWLLGMLGRAGEALPAIDRALAIDAEPPNYTKLRDALIAGAPLRRLHPYKRARA
ncbi:alpha/beta hydrolase [Sphingomonas naphthae]|uniref:Alpha/beta hydrolase n=1 Tax=Sphingomonas naphthae TaxID=1813468 RepID=A0ABY7TIQ0_9SPHN|nr:alpha/beta hydrolase [Sphingomonas naphthae]WCT72788.1 alpha/beta hydrolase [Sphingomonas naphthae]